MLRCACLVTLCGVLCVRGGRQRPARKAVVDERGARCHAWRRCDVANNATNVVHVVASRITWGGSENYYHWMFGRIVPLLHWFGAGSYGAGDAVVVNDGDGSANGTRERWTDDLLDRVVAPFACVSARKAHLAKSFIEGDVNAALAALGYGPAAAAVLHPWESGMDASLYGCGSLPDDSRAILAYQMATARAFGVGACGCCRRPEDAPLRVLVVARARDQRRTKRPRSAPNLPNLVAALRGALGDVRGRRVEVDAVEFASMSLCDQWCAAASAAVVVGQHGAGLANAIFLDGSAGGVVEIAPPNFRDTKTIFHCAAGLRGSHYARVLQDASDAPVDVAGTVAAVAALLARAAANATPAVEGRYPASTYSARSNMRRHCDAGLSEGTGWTPRIRCTHTKRG